MKSETPVQSLHEARVAAFKSLYSVVVGKEELADALEAGAEGKNFGPELKDWIKDVVGRIAGAGVAWDEKYQPHLNAAWTLERLALTDRLCLRMACFELWSFPEVSPRITVSEYMKIATNFGSKESAKFVNGVLAEVVKASPKSDWKAGEIPVALPKIDALPEPEPEPILVPEEQKATSAWVIKSDG